MRNTNETPRLQWKYAGARGSDYFADYSKIEHKYEAEASWSTPLGPERYRIWHRGQYSTYYSVVRLKPSTGKWEYGGPRKFSGTH